MQRGVVSSPDQSHVEQADHQIWKPGRAVHKLINNAPQKPSQILPFLSALRNGIADLANERLRAKVSITPLTLLRKEFVFQVDENLTSSATRVMFNNSDRIGQHICLKMWLCCQNELYQTEDVTKQTEFLLEGLAFNRRFSAEVYFGIAPILSNGLDRIKCGPLIENPALENLAINRPYALVMKRLKEEWRLDHQLHSGKLGNVSDMEFLAGQVAELHSKLDRSLAIFGTPARIANKLDFNIGQFHKALDARRINPHVMANSAFSETDMTWIEAASSLLTQLSKAHWYDFKKRRREGHVKRCHGDLKAANLWICQAES